MSGRFQPEAGADSDYTLKPYRVHLKDTEGPAWWVEIPHALGKHDAKHQAIEKAYDEGADAVGVIAVEEAA